MLENIDPQNAVVTIASISVAVAVIKNDLKHVWKRLDEHHKMLMKILGVEE